MKAANWTYAMNEAALPEGGMAPAYPLGVNVVMARVDGVVYAVSGKCAHMACPLFAGRLDGHSLNCPCHGWRFDIRTGQFRRRAGVGDSRLPGAIRSRPAAS